MQKVLILLLCFSANCFAQNTLSLPATSSSPNATLEDVSWIAGHWKGEAFGGVTEEIWSPPLGDSMMFVFKLVSEGKVKFYEAGHIQYKNETLVLQLKHFDSSLKGWEEKEETVDFPLVRLEGNRIYFDGFTIEKISGNEINMYVVIGQKDGSSEEVKFNYKKME